MILAKLVALSVLNLITVYLFVSAPDPLPEDRSVSAASDKSVPIEQVFEAVNTINHEARRIYTARVVGAGKQAGLDFAEDWRNKDRESGPLPALFLRLVSSELAKRPEPLGLFLGSDNPINPSNLFTGEQKSRFSRVKEAGAPQFFRMPDGQQIAMYPDVASAEPCVTCHNEHKSSPKQDWKLNDVMGATTWIHTEPAVSLAEFQAIVANVYSSIESAWRIYLDKTTTFDSPPTIGSEWPGIGALRLPNAETFMTEVYQSSAPKVLRILNRQLKSAPTIASAAAGS